MTPPSLDALRDIQLPPEPMLATALTDWGLGAAALVLIATCWYVLRFWRRRYLRAALRELRLLAAVHARDGDAIRLASGVSGLVRRYAIARFPQARIAGLAGMDWLRFLDAHGGGGDFCDGAGAALESLPYQPCGSLDDKALIALVRRWLKANPQ